MSILYWFTGDTDIDGHDVDVNDIETETESFLDEGL